MARSEFINDLLALGYAWKDHSGNPGHINLGYIEYTVPLGRFAGENILLGFNIGDEFPIACPTGPHMSPRLLPMHPAQADHPIGGVHDSPFGSDWQYWSRPFHPWLSTGRKAEDYLRHIRHLFDFQ